MNQNGLNKTCIKCGLKKPLSSFLEMGGAQGTHYGNVCAECRKTNLSADKQKMTEESTSDSTGFKIDIKAKVKGEIDKKSEREQKEKLYHEARGVDQKRQTQQKEKNQVIKGEETKRRQSLRSFLNESRKITQRKEGVTPREQAKQLETEIDVDSSFLDLSQEKFKWSAFKRDLLTGSAPIRQAEKRNQKNPAPEKGKDALIDYIEKNFKPGSKK